MTQSPYITWNTRDARRKKWAELDAKGLTWNMWETDSDLPGPVISGTDSHLGRKYEAFSISFTVTPFSPDMRVEIRILLDDAVIFTKQDVQGLYEGVATVSAEALAAMTPDTPHSIGIAVRDHLGGASARSYTFTMIEDLRVSSIFYLLRDGQPIQRSESIEPLFDYAAVGTHRYKVRAVDRFGSFTDSNEYSVSSDLDCTVLAPASAPENMIFLRYRIGEPPEHESRLNVGSHSYLFEGRRYAVLEDTGERSASFSVSFSAQTREEYERVLALTRTGEAVIYRDAFGNRAFVCIDALPVAFLETAADFTLVMTQLEDSAEVAYD